MPKVKESIEFKDIVTGDTFLERKLLPSQLKFWNSEKAFILLSGGYGSGKTEPLIMRVIYECMAQPNNYFLLGRKTYQEIYDVLWKDFMDLCHASWIKDVKKSPHPTVTMNTFYPGKTSTIIFRNLDKLAETEIKGLNLGGFAIDQVEDIPEETFQGLTFRLRRQNIKHKVFLTQNPELNWLHRRVKANTDDKWEVIEAPSTENYINLPKDTVELYESYKESDPGYYKQYVLAVWDESLLSENIAFAREHIEKLLKYERKPKRVTEGIRIYEDYKEGHRYQVGVDCAEGVEGGDNAAITIADLDTMEEVAHWADKLPPEATAEKAVHMAGMFMGSASSTMPPMIVPEMNSMGSSVVNKLKDLEWPRIYQREEIDNKTGKKVNKLGWRTSASTKPLLISHFRDLLRNAHPKVYTRETLDEFKTFIYTDEAKKKGVGAKQGYHDDRLISLFLAFWEKGKWKPGKVTSPTGEQDMGRMIVIKNGKAYLKGMKPLLQVEKNWMTT